MPCFWHVWCRVCGMFCGLNWEDIVVGGQGLFRDGFGSKLVCTGAVNELSGMLVRGSHAIAWLGSKLQLSGTQLSGTHAIAWLGSKLQPSGMQLRVFPSNCVALAHLQTSNFGRP